MATSQMSLFIQHLRKVLGRDEAGVTDGQLLNRFLNFQDEHALTALIKRHAPMVWGVCCRLLHSHHDAEDAFQATFLVLVRKVATIRDRELVANWLYGVAHQTAVRLRATAAKQGVRERQVAEMPEPAVTENLGNDLLPFLDQELSRLPVKYRAVIVLCDLEGKTRKEAARQLGVPDGTVAGWLARARTMLAKRLARHGPALSGGVLAVVLSKNAVSACVPISVLFSTIKAASLFAAGQTVSGAISVKVAALTEGVLKAMLLTQLKTASVVLLVVLFGIGSGLLVMAGAAHDKQSLPPASNSGEKRADAFNEAAKKDLQALQGDWILQSIEENGMKVELGDNQQGILTFKDTTWSFAPTNEQGEVVALDPTTNPKLIDIKSTPKGREAFVKEGIYKLDGDTLTICLGKDKNRPTNFDPPKEAGTKLMTHKRAKP
jgi:RNA polymerase sigma factor (sigma-70 family)